jgi:two-component system, sensor histidine kinase and response regulator
LFSVISHDLRGPMATLHALLDLLSKKQLTPDEFVMVSDKLRGSMDITKRTLENLLNWSLSQMEGIRTEPTILDLREVISESCHLMKDLADNKQLDIRLDVDDAIQVRADANHVQLILRNLIHNAIKFSKPSNHILISAIQKGDQCLISIKDFGIGMTAHELEKVISVKQHFSKRGTQQEKGTGLGLLLCREFVKLNGGDLSIMSKSDEGTEVTFTLPMSLQLKSVKQVEFV